LVLHAVGIGRGVECQQLVVGAVLHLEALAPAAGPSSSLGHSKGATR
jgi:hypothetical protein